MTREIYCPAKHQRSDSWLHSPALVRHVRQAYAHRLSAFNLSDSQLNLSTTTFDHDAHYCVDCEFTATDDEDKEICLTGRAAFRCRTPGYLHFGDVTISKGFADGRPAEFYKTRASTMIYAHENNAGSPDDGFPLVVMFDLSHTINLIEMGHLLAVGQWKGSHEKFYGVKISDLYKHNLLWYVGICPTQRTAKVHSSLEGVFKKDMPVVWDALRQARSYWSAVPCPGT